MAISEKLKALIRSAWDDGAPCLVATQGPNGPNISPKGSMVVFDDDHQASSDRPATRARHELSHRRSTSTYSPKGSTVRSPTTIISPIGSAQRNKRWKISATTSAFA